MRNRATRVGVGLVALIPLLGIAGTLVASLGLGGEAVGWITLGIGLVWIALVTWWARRVPAARSEEASARYWAALRHAQYHPQHHDDGVRHGA